MPSPYPVELRWRVVHAYERGDGSFRELAEFFEIGIATVNRWWSRFRDGLSIEPEPHGGGYPAAIHEKGLCVLLLWLEVEADLTLEELVARYEKRFRIRVSSSAMSRALLKAGFTRKKRPSMQQNAIPIGCEPYARRFCG